jgi:hypothetical protein
VKLLFFCTRWGHEHLSWDDFCKKVKDAGYDGIETSLPLDIAGLTEISAALDKQLDLQLIAVQWDTGTAVFYDYAKEYQLRLKSAATIKPLFITSHTGKDFFNFNKTNNLLDMAQNISQYNRGENHP